MEGEEAHAEIMGIAGSIKEALDQGALEAGAECFIDYWNRAGAWRSMKPVVREEILTYLPKAPLNFASLGEESAPSTVYTDFRFPVMVMRGGRSPSLRAGAFVRHSQDRAQEAALRGDQGRIAEPARAARRLPFPPPVSARAICRQEVPSMREVAPGHRSACHMTG